MKKKFLQAESSSPGLNTGPMLDIKGINVEYFSSGGIIPALRDVDLSLREGECLGVAGESGSGKSTLAFAILNLIDENEGRIFGGDIVFYEKKGQKTNLTSAPPGKLQNIRGNSISLITQDPYTSFNPVIKIGHQMKEVYEIHSGISSKNKFIRKASAVLESVNLQPPEQILNSYPHQLSGGMLQRASIATALLNNPRLLIADEPTSSLDVTIQKKIMETLKQLRRRYNLTVIFITHDLNLISSVAGRIYILYAGKVMETAGTGEIFKNPRHPYTISLLKALPKLGTSKKITSIPGSPPSPGDLKDGCAFAPRCPVATGKCFKQEPPFITSGESGAACFKIK